MRQRSLVGQELLEGEGGREGGREGEGGRRERGRGREGGREGGQDECSKVDALLH